MKSLAAFATLLSLAAANPIVGRDSQVPCCISPVDLCSSVQGDVANCNCQREQVASCTTDVSAAGLEGSCTITPITWHCKTLPKLPIPSSTLAARAPASTEPACAFLEAPVDVCRGTTGDIDNCKCQRDMVDFYNREVQQLGLTGTCKVPSISMHCQTLPKIPIVTPPAVSARQSLPSCGCNSIESECSGLTGVDACKCAYDVRQSCLNQIHADGSEDTCVAPEIPVFCAALPKLPTNVPKPTPTASPARRQLPDCGCASIESSCSGKTGVDECVCAYNVRQACLDQIAKDGSEDTCVAPKIPVFCAALPKLPTNVPKPSATAN